ncbi:hypothetical protein Bbelb_442700, partial [Branchiostoma belcheri]
GGPVSILAACERPQQFAGACLLVQPSSSSWEAPGWKGRSGGEDEVTNQKIQDDPLCFHGGLKLRTAAQILTDDEVVNSEGSKMLYEKARSADKTIKTYPNCRHGLLKETKEDADKVKQDILEWLLARTEPS